MKRRAQQNQEKQTASPANLISRAEAKAAGLKRYFTGKPCSQGHLAEKLVSNRRCVGCSLAESKTPKARARLRASEGQKRRQKAHLVRHAINNRAKVLARKAVTNAVNRGKLKKEPCKVCRNPNSEAHHSDYSRPLDVVWLCAKHHQEVHTNG